MQISRYEARSQDIIHELSQKYFGVGDIFAKVGMTERDLAHLRYALEIHEPEVQTFLQNYAEFSKNRRGNLESILKILFRNDIYTLDNLSAAIASKKLDHLRGIGRENKRIIRDAYNDYWILTMDPDVKGA